MGESCGGRKEVDDGSDSGEFDPEDDDEEERRRGASCIRGI